MSTQVIKLNRKQVKLLVKTFKHFKEVDEFVLESDNSNGIGPVVTLRFDLIKSQPIEVDLTDVERW